jgi:hypothetical protein
VLRRIQHVLVHRALLGGVRSHRRQSSICPSLRSPLHDVLHTSRDPGDDGGLSCARPGRTPGPASGAPPGEIYQGVELVAEDDEP